MSRFLRIYLLAIALPALLLALFGARLLRVDAERQATAIGETRRMFAEQVAGRLQGFVRGEIDRRLDALLAASDGAERLAALRALVRTDPLVRNAFLWREGEGCVWPRRLGATEEERRFLNRYESLFSGAVPWVVPASSSSGTGGLSAPADPGKPPLRGYRPWASGDRQELLAWVRTAPGEICGVELETMRLLADLSSGGDLFLPFGDARSPWRRTARVAAPELVPELLDESGAVLVLAPVPTADASGLNPAAETPVAPLFPRWRVRISPARDAPDAWRAAAYAPNLRFAFGAVLLGLLLLSLVGGGFVLFRAARRERLDALRKTDFVSNVSHELRTPLTSIRMFSELLAEDRIADPDRRRRALGTIASESARLSRLVEGVLDFSRLERNRRKYDLRPLDLGELLSEMRNAQCSMHNAEGVDTSIVHSAFSIVHCERGYAALADRDAVRQIVLNLLDNAAKYAPGAPPEMVVRAAGNGMVALAVLDRGPGIPRRHARHVFDRFYRVDNAATRETGGNGLGLSIARRLARGMGGDLVYRPREGGGAEFELTLPVVSSTPAPPQNQ